MVVNLMDPFINRLLIVLFCVETNNTPLLQNRRIIIDL